MYERTVIAFEMDQKTIGYLQLNQLGEMLLGLSLEVFPERIN